MYSHGPFWLALLAFAAHGVAGSDERQCDLPIVDAKSMTPEEFQERFVQERIPVVLQNAMTSWPALTNWRWENLREAFRGIPLRVGPGPYPSKTMSIDDYLDSAQEIYDSQSGEVPGVFQYGQVPTSWSLWAHKDLCVPEVAFLHPSSMAIHPNYTVACELLSNIKVPNFLVGDESVQIPPNTITHSGVLIGFKHSGIDFHRHQAAINVIFHGQKEWFMKVEAPIAKDIENMPEYNQRARFCDNNPTLDVCSSHSLQQLVIERKKKTNGGSFSPDSYESAEERFLDHLGAFSRWIKTSQVTEELEENSVLLRCTQNAGEIVYIPHRTQHAVRNLDHTVAMQMQWDSDFHNNKWIREDLYRYLLSSLDPEEPDPDFDEDRVVFQDAEKLANEQAELYKSIADAKRMRYFSGKK